VPAGSVAPLLAAFRRFNEFALTKAIVVAWRFPEAPDDG
jgi:hypothetical protein